MEITNQIQDMLQKAGKKIHGRDSDYDDTVVTYESIVEWKKEIRTEDDRRSWYEHAFDYWEENCTATVDGVLGGFASLSTQDLEGSADFIRHLKSTIRPELKLTHEENGGVPTRACECGAGKFSFRYAAWCDRG